MKPSFTAAVLDYIPAAVCVCAVALIFGAMVAAAATGLDLIGWKP